MSRQNKTNQHSPSRINYIPIANRCPICMKLHNKSKKFGTPYQLQYHLNNHDSDDENTAGISVLEISHTIKVVTKAVQWGMLLL
jgi:hypothetical protein